MAMAERTQAMGANTSIKRTITPCRRMVSMEREPNVSLYKSWLKEEARSLEQVRTEKYTLVTP
jgi:hypothetical protein